MTGWRETRNLSVGVLVLFTAVTYFVARAEDSSPSTDQREHELRRLQAYSRELVREIEALRAELARLTRERDEQATRHQGALAARDAQLETLARQLADAERRAKERTARLETLQSVLQNTRSAGAELHAALDQARSRNGELLRQIAQLNDASGKAHDLNGKYPQKELRPQELAHDIKAEQKEIQTPRLQQSSAASELHDGCSRQLASAVSPTPTTSAQPTPSLESSAPLEPQNDRETGELREQLSLERERRETLEQEVQRLTANGHREEKFTEVWNALQSARSEILVLTNQLAEERKSRESLEVALARVEQERASQPQPASDYGQRLAATLNERRSEADRLAEQLTNANEIIVRLRGQLEANSSSLAGNNVLADVEKDNGRLKAALVAAEDANAALRTKAELAERLAEMVYGQSR